MDFRFPEKLEELALTLKEIRSHFSSVLNQTPDLNSETKLGANDNKEKQRFERQ